ncbi:MAG: flagellar biosynthesis protein FlhF [Bacteroidia bacterium]|jgi:flagellar biosynthesis protein FlhF
MMRIHRVKGRSMDDALRRARAVCGDQAVVLSQESVAGGGVTLSITDAPVGAGKIAKQRRSAPRGSTPNLGGGFSESADIVEVRERLLRSGCSSDFVERVLGPVKRIQSQGTHAIDAAAQVVGRLFKKPTSPKASGNLRVLSVVGPTGVGKTTSLAKLAVLLIKSGRRVAFATMDTYRVGAVDQLRAYAEVLQVPLYVAHGGDELARTVDAAGDFDVLLVDTAGRSPVDTENITLLARDLERAGKHAILDTYIVLSAASGKDALERARSAYSVLNPRAAILTKVDETRESGAALEFFLRNGIETSFLCDGQDVNDNIHRATASCFADLLLSGHIS